jgi:DNA modification methylase
MGNKIFKGDCFNLIEKINDESIDLVITDPPYGDNVGYGRAGKEILNNEDETINYRFLDKIYPKMKMNTSCYLFTNWKFETKLRDYIENKTEFNLRMMLVIVKNNIGMGYGFRNQYEICLVLEKGKASYNFNNFSTVVKMDNINHSKETHPHTKALNIIEKIIKHSSNEGDLVFDGFLGSGSVIEGCIRTNRMYLGAELDNKWFNLIEERIIKWKGQKTLF